MFPKSYFVIAAMIAFSSWAASPSIGFQPGARENIKPLDRPTLKALRETRVNTLPYPAAQLVKACKSQFSDREAAQIYCVCYATQSDQRLSDKNFSIWSDIFTRTSNGSATSWVELADQFNLSSSDIQAFQAVNNEVNTECLPFRAAE